MKRVLLRLLAYILAGLLLGGAARWVLFSDVMTPVSIVITAALVAVAVVISVMLLMRASSVVSHGIRVNPAWTVAAMDSICLIASAMAAFFIFDGYAELLFGLAKGPTDPLAADVIAVMYLPAALVLALFVTSSGSQSVRIDAAGVSIAGAFGVESTAWETIEKLRADAQYVTVSRLGLPIPSHLRTNLEMVIRDDEVFTIYQPGLKATSRVILEKMKQYIPARLSAGLGEIEDAWL